MCCGGLSWGFEDFWYLHAVNGLVTLLRAATASLDGTSFCRPEMILSKVRPGKADMLLLELGVAACQPLVLNRYVQWACREREETAVYLRYTVYDTPQ